MLTFANRQSDAERLFHILTAQQTTVSTIHFLALVVMISRVFVSVSEIMASLKQLHLLVILIYCFSTSIQRFLAGEFPRKFCL